MPPYLLSIAIGLLQAAPAPAASVIPADRQVKVTLVATLAAPADAPMHMPTDVAVDSRGNVFVADGANDRVVRFDAAGRFRGARTRVGDQTLAQPVGLTVDAGDRLWIADTGNHRIVIATMEEEPLPGGRSPDGDRGSDGGRSSGEDRGSAERHGSAEARGVATVIELPGTQQHTFDPTDVVVTPDGKRAYIVDNENHRLAIRDNQTGQIHFIGGFGESLGRFRWPFMLALTADGYVHITEAIGARAQRLSPDDRWAGQVGRWGVEMGQLHRPKGIAVSPRGHVLIGDSTLHVVQVFSPRGETLGVLTEEDGKPFRFQHPMGMTFDAKGRLYVVELTAHRVAIVSLPPQWTGPPPATSPEGSP